MLLIGREIDVNVRCMMVFIGLLFSLATGQAALSDLSVFTDEASYLGTLHSLGYQSIFEGFEDDAAWGTVRTTVGGQQTAPSITNQGITWTSNVVSGEITTGGGPARTGDWGFFALPHGDPANGIGDGFVGNSDITLFGVGGWIETNTPPAGISLLLDGVAVDFDGNDALGNSHAFFGAIDTAGFTRFDYLETEFGGDELKLIFADDFTFAVAVPEPSSFAAFLISACLGCCCRSRRK